MTEKNWKYTSPKASNEAVAETATQLKLPYFIAQLLANRGVTGVDATKNFLTKSARGIHNPMLLNGMEAAANRIKTAVEQKQPIVVYGDYDADGVTSTVILYSFLKSIGATVSYYIPSRIKEGYGMNALAVSKLARKNKLLISVDCGIASVGEVELAQLSGMDVIITDHHTPQEKLPRALAVLNPKVEGSGYPFLELAGCGVALKVALAVAMVMGIPTMEVFNKYAPIAAIGTIADIVSLTDENRIIVNKGLELLTASPIPGVGALLEVAHINEHALNSIGVSFGIVPRLNAAGRMDSADTAVKLLLSDDKAEALRLATELETLNVTRKTIEQEIYDAAMVQIGTMTDLDKRKVIIVSGDGWHEGVIGIVAARLGERLNRTTIVLSKDDKGVAKGSGRSYCGVNLFEALDHCKDNLIKFGGHAKAAGLSIAVESIATFDKAINAYVNEHISADDQAPTLAIDMELNANQITVANAKLLKYLEPFGTDNEEPIFSIIGATVDSVARIGGDGRHMRLNIVKDNAKLQCVGFGLGDYTDKLTVGCVVDLAFNLDVNEFRGEQNAQLRIKDIHIA